MILPDNVYRWISRNGGNLPLIGLVTFGFPRLFLRSIYNGNRGKDLWRGRKTCVTLSFDCDYPEDVEAIPGILKTMEGYSYKWSFAAVGNWIERYPREHEMVLEHGHEIVNHTYSHPDNELLNPGRKFRTIPYAEKREEVERCHEVCEQLLGYAPTGLRIPHFKNLFTPEIYSILAELGYRYSSSTWLTNTTTRGLPFTTPEGIVEIPVSTCPKHPFTVFDTWHSLNTPRLSHRLGHRGPARYLELFRELIELGKATGSYINIYMDPLDVPKLSGFEAILDLLAADDVLVVTYEEYLKSQLYVEPGP